MTGKSKTQSQTLFAKNMTRLRKDAGLTRLKLAELAGLTHVFLSSIEHEKKGVSFETIDLLSEALGVEPIQFFVNPTRNKNNENEHFLAIMDCLNLNINRMFDIYKNMMEIEKAKE